MTDMPWLTPPNNIIYVCQTDDCSEFGVEKSVSVTQMAANLIAGPSLGFCIACGHATPIKSYDSGGIP